MSRAHESAAQNIGMRNGINRLNLRLSGAPVKPEHTPTQDYECFGVYIFVTTRKYVKTRVALIHRFSIRSEEVIPSFSRLRPQVHVKHPKYGG
jgi:hypothetical protein